MYIIYTYKCEREVGSYPENSIVGDSKDTNESTVPVRRTTTTTSTTTTTTTTTTTNNNNNNKINNNNNKTYIAPISILLFSLAINNKNISQKKITRTS